MKKTFLIAAAAVAFAVPAAAQDTMDDGSNAPSEFFNGFYLGGTFGLDYTANKNSSGIAFDTNRDGKYDNTVRTVAGANAFSPGFCGGAAAGNAPAGGCRPDRDRYGYSIRAGYDTRLGPDNMIVMGVVGEATKSDSIDYVSAFSTTPASYTIGRGLDHSFALRGRVGISPGEGRGLLYLTGGVAYGKMEHSFATTNTANSFTQVNDNEYRLGSQFGGGGELVVAPNISLAFEFIHQRFRDDKYYVAVGQGTAPATNPFLLNGGGTNFRPANTNYDLDSFRVGMNFRF